MIDLLRAELLKLRTTRMVYALLGALLAIVALVNIVTVATGTTSDFVSEEDQAGMFGAAASGIIFVLLLGVMLLAGEFRHGTITQTLLITPNRWKVLTAKLVAGAILGLVFGVIAELFSLLITIPLLEAKGVDLVLGDEAASLVAGVVLTSTLCAMLGVALASVIRNQIAAIIVVFVSLLIVESILTASLESRWPEIPKYFPGHAIAAVIDDEAEDAHSRAGGAAVLLGYVLVLGGIGGKFVFQRDVNSIQA